MSNPYPTAPLQEVPTRETFDESCYLAANPDVADAVGRGKIVSGWAHFKKFGLTEGRRRKVSEEEMATAINFDESGYLASHPDAQESVSQGVFATSHAHFDAVRRVQKRPDPFACEREVACVLNAGRMAETLRSLSAAVARLSASLSQHDA